MLSTAAASAVFLVVGIHHCARDESLKRKARRFDEYCQFVRVRLETSVRILEDDGSKVATNQIRLRQAHANSFYGQPAHRDIEEVQRCSAPEISSSEMYRVRDRCRPPALCREDECNVDPECLAGAIRDLLKFLPKG